MHIVNIFTYAYSEVLFESVHIVLMLVWKVNNICILWFASLANLNVFTLSLSKFER